MSSFDKLLGIIVISYFTFLSASSYFLFKEKELQAQLSTCSAQHDTTTDSKN